MSLKPPENKLEKLQAALRSKAKAFPNYRFYLLYDKVYRADVLAEAYRCCRRNDGAPGVDGQTFRDIETYGRDRWLGELAEELRKKTYQPQAVLRRWIPKADGKQRPLGIPTIRDRVVQTATVLILEAIFEEDLQPEQYAYRAGRSQHDALGAVTDLIQTGYTEVVDADLSGYFDAIPHAELMKSVARRISDRHLLHLIKMWLEAPVEETDDQGRKQRTTRNKDEGRGTPQGGVASPLLANLYMRRFVLGWKTLGYEEQLDARLVNYADDFVICTRPGRAEAAMDAMRGIMGKLKLTVNEKKTRICRLPEETFNFLGYKFGRRYSFRKGRYYLGLTPKAEAIQGACRTISERTERHTTWQVVGEVVTDLNQKIRGWSSYFSLGEVVPAYKTVLKHARKRLRRWLVKKHKIRGMGYKEYPDEYLHSKLGLIQLRGVN
jgi:group II intron reverse transcriptase/maturase